MPRSTTTERTASQAACEGFTLVELMVVVAILAILAAIAVPALTRDTSASDFSKFVRKLTQHLHRAKVEAISTREDRAVRLTDSSTYTLDGVLGTSYFELGRVKFSDRVQLRGLKLCTAVPGITCTAPSSFSAAEIRFAVTGEVQACTGTACTPSDSSASVFLISDDGQHKARLVIYGATGYIRHYSGWP